MIRDAVALEEKGIPTVTLVHDKFIAAARAQGRVLKLANLQLVSVPQPLPWETLEDEDKKAENLLGSLIAMISKPEASESQVTS